MTLGDQLHALSQAPGMPERPMRPMFDHEAYKGLDPMARQDFRMDWRGQMHDWHGARRDWRDQMRPWRGMTLGSIYSQGFPQGDSQPGL